MMGLLLIGVVLSVVNGDHTLKPDPNPCSNLVGFNDFQDNRWCNTACKATKKVIDNKKPTLDDFMEFYYLSSNCAYESFAVNADGGLESDGCFAPYSTVSSANLKEFFEVRGASTPALCQGECQSTDEDKCHAVIFIPTAPDSKSHCYLLTAEQAQAVTLPKDQTTDGKLTEGLCTDEAEKAGDCLICDGQATNAVKQTDTLFAWRWCQAKLDMCKVQSHAYEHNPQAKKFC